MDKKIGILALGFAMLIGNPLIGFAANTAELAITTDETSKIAAETVTAAGLMVPLAIAESQDQSKNILPPQYAMYSTMMKTVVTDYDAGFGFTLPWRVAEGVVIDKVVPSESGHIQGYSFQLTGPQVDEMYMLNFTKRNNTPPEGVSQKLWNSTWYDVPIKGMTNTEYVDIWRKNSEIGVKNNVSGGFFEHKGATSARWSRIVPKDTKTSESNTFFEVEFIMGQDSTHRYNMANVYPISAQTFIEQGILGTVAPSFHLVNQKDYRPAGELTVADGITFVKPAGFTRIRENGKIVFEKGPIRLEVESIAMSQHVNITAPTLVGKQRLGDLYVANLVDVNKATIERYESHIINGQVSFLVVGRMIIPGDSKEVAFASTIIFGNQGYVGIARVVAPVGTDLTTSDVVAALDGMRISDVPQNNKSTIIL